MPDPGPPIVKKSTGQNTTLTPHTITVVSNAACFAFLKDMEKMPSMAAIMIIRGAIDINGKPATTRDIRAIPEAIAPNMQIKFKMREPNGNSSEIK
jgi:hypothetical protein